MTRIGRLQYKELGMRASVLRSVLQGFLALVLISAFVGPVSAQAPSVHVFRASTTIAPSAVKSALHVIRGFDEAGMVSVDGSLLKVKLTSSASGAQILDALNSEGAAYTLHGSQRSSTESGMPSRIDTGDPAGDDARYDAAKHSWIEQHPEEYRAIGNGASEQVPGTKTP